MPMNMPSMPQQGQPQQPGQLPLQQQLEARRQIEEAMPLAQQQRNPQWT